MEKDASVADSEEDCNGDWVTVLEFNYSMEIHFRPMETISKLCGEAEEDDDYAIQQTDIQCFVFLNDSLNNASSTFMYVCMCRVRDVSPVLVLLLYHF